MGGLWHCSVAPLVSSSQHTCSHPAEVEDKRQALEDEVAQLRRQTVRWRRRVDAGEQQRKKLQAQLNMMAQMQGSKADKSKLDRLEQSLSQAKSDQHMLMRQVKKLEEQLEESNRLLRHARAGDSARSLRENGPSLWPKAVDPALWNAHASISSTEAPTSSAPSSPSADSRIEKACPSTPSTGSPPCC